MSVKLNYKSFGEGQPLIILHGLFGMLDNWQTLAKKLAERFEVYLVDLRDHGKSPHTEAFTYEAAARDLKEFMDDHDLTSAHLIGHSMGGKVAMVFAQQYSSRVDQLIIVDIAPKAYPGGHEEIFDGILSVDIEAAEGRSDVDLQLAKSILDQGVRLFLMKNLSRRVEGGYEWKANFKILHESYPEIMSEVLSGETVSHQTLFIKGGLSHYIVKDDKDLIDSIFTNAEVKTVEGAGHWVHAQKPNELLAVVNEFLM